MIFLFRKKPITLYCTTQRKDVLEVAPIKAASKCFPSWWKELPSSIAVSNTIFPSPTMKNCSGFVDLYKSGAMLSLWSDLALSVGSHDEPMYQYQFADRKSEVTSHPQFHMGNNFPECVYQHLKIMSPWSFMCDEEIKFLCVAPTWSLLKYPTISILPGVMDFKNQSTTAINLFVKRLPQNQTFVIPVGEPLIHYIPLSDRKLKIICTDDQDMIKKASSVYSPVSFTKQYQTYKKLKEQNRRK